MDILIILCSLSAKGDMVLPPETKVLSDCDRGLDRGEPKLFGFTTSEKKAFKSPAVKEFVYVLNSVSLR